MSLMTEVQQLSDIAISMGLIMKCGQFSFRPIKLSLQPYLIKKMNYQLLQKIHKVWQKLIYLASKDQELIVRTFEEVAKYDDMIQQFYKIYLQTVGLNRGQSLMFTRVDFFKNNHEEFKIIEYNLTSVSMASHSQNFNRAKQYLNKNYLRNDPTLQFPQNNPATNISEAVSEIYNLKQLKGLFLIVVSSNEKNVSDQSYLQIKLLQKGINSKRVILCCLYKNIKIVEDKLFYKGQQVSMVYYRAGYQPTDYCEGSNFDQSWQARKMIQLSGVIKIPDIKMELMNQKRMQVELSKEHIYRRYLTQDEGEILKKSLVFTTDFGGNPEDIDYLTYIEQKGTDKFILKPNLQGGGHNIYGKNAYQTLKQLSQQEKKKYILMEKIETNPVSNILFEGSKYQRVSCICEISRYGILAQMDGKLLKNDCNGYLVRVKPQLQNQGGIMVGIGAISSMAFQE